MCRCVQVSVCTAVHKWVCSFSLCMFVLCLCCARTCVRTRTHTLPTKHMYTIPLVHCTQARALSSSPLSKAGLTPQCWGLSAKQARWAKAVLGEQLTMKVLSEGCYYILLLRLHYHWDKASLTWGITHNTPEDNHSQPTAVPCTHPQLVGKREFLTMNGYEKHGWAKH